MNEPRIHFLLNCAATSSPKLWNRAYTNRNITQALEERTLDYINDSTKNITTNGEVNLSSPEKHNVFLEVSRLDSLKNSFSDLS